MNIKYLVTQNLISVEANEIGDYITNISDYTGVTLGVSYCSLTTEILNTANNTDILDNTKNFYIESGILYIKPILFGFTSFIDSIYTLDIKFNKTSGFIEIKNCSFIDITFQCKVATYLKTILTSDESTIVHLLHYSLVNGSNCGCNCDDLCTVFNALSNLLTGIDPQIINDCGC